jgi:AcrR family transcriptional regulator
MPRAQVAEIQRSRLLAGAVGAIEEHGYAQTTVAQITARARVSRRTFYELFADCEACLVALLEDVVELLERAIADASLGDLAWHERVRGGLAAILAFFDREPALAQVCVVQALRGGSAVLERREQLLARLAAILDEGRGLGSGRGSGSRPGGCSPLTAEGLVGATFGIIHGRLLRGERAPLSGLLGELMGMIVLPYLGAAAARREQARPAVAATPAAERGPTAHALANGDPLQGLPMRLTYRTARVLECVARQPGVSNRAVAGLAGIADQGQVSKLLARLERLELVENTGAGHQLGAPNAWRLTLLGRRVALSLSVSDNHYAAGS